MAGDLRLQAKALGDPTRYRLFRYIADAQAPVTVAELTAFTGLNHNAIRQHLDPADLLEQEIAQRGFRPVRADSGAKIEFTLGRCPFAEVAASDPDTICQLHLGLAEGLTEGLGGLAVDRLTIKPAQRAGCRLTGHRTAAATRISV